MDAFISGLVQVLQWHTLGLLLLGVLFGIFLGVIPGLGVIIGLVVLLPFTFGMDPVSAFALLLGMYAVTSTSDTISSVMLGVPGTSASQATILDGYPLAQQGQGARALGAAFTVSAFGGVFGALVLAASLPLIRPIMQSVGSPEIFMLGLLGLTMVGALSGKSVSKGLVVAALGLLMSTVGYSDSGAVPRYYFGVEYLVDGLPLIPVVLGLFALPELMGLAIRDASISNVTSSEVKGGSILDGVKDTFKHKWLALRCAFIGTYIGMLPGLGASIVDWLAYGHAVQSAKDKSKFGHGDIRGVIAPEAANNATRGGSLVPTVAFGVPGSLGAAILLGALLIVGLKPGPEMLTTELSTTFSMVWSIAIANVFAAILLLLGAKYIAKVAFVPGHLIVPAIVIFVFMGAWLGGGDLGDWVICLVMACVGFTMKNAGWPRAPLVLALVLGSIMENAYLLTARVYDGFEWMLRPIVLIIAAIIMIALFFVTRGIIRQKRNTNNLEKSVTDRGGDSGDAEATPKGYVSFSLLLSFILLSLFALSIWFAREWSPSVKQFPMLLGIFGTTLMIVVISTDVLEFRNKLRAGSGGVASLLGFESAEARLPKALLFLVYLIAMVLVMLVVGQKIALPLFVFVYLVRWGGYSYRMAIPYALVSWLFMVLFYDRVMHLFWYQSLLSGWLASVLPNGFPAWLFI